MMQMLLLFLNASAGVCVHVPCRLWDTCFCRGAQNCEADHVYCFHSGMALSVLRCWQTYMHTYIQHTGSLRTLGSKRTSFLWSTQPAMWVPLFIFSGCFIGCAVAAGVSTILFCFGFYLAFQSCGFQAVCDFFQMKLQTRPNRKLPPALWFGQNSRRWLYIFGVWTSYIRAKKYFARNSINALFFENT